jgi:predicted transcriptional regulator
MLTLPQISDISRQKSPKCSLARLCSLNVVRPQGGAVFGLGELESAIMDVLWRTEEPAKVRDVLDGLSGKRRLAYTTVMTVLDNLYRKGWVERERDGKAYRYEPAFSREEATARILREVLESSGDPDGALLQFASTASDRERELLRSGLRRKARRR